MKEIKISVSILSADFSHLQEQIELVKNADMIHIDVMDGHFVPPLTMGPVVIENLKSNMIKDVHLMVANPENLVEPFAKAGADIITFHAEAVEDIFELLEKIKSHGVKAGLSINPDTPSEKIIPFLDKVDHVLVMSVFPGYSGQKFISDVVPKIAEIRNKFDGDIAVDGGITDVTAKSVVQAGANVLVAASYIYKNEDPSKAVDTLRNVGESNKSSQ